MSDYKHLSHVKSRVVIDESPKLPSSDSIIYGELAVNYAKDYETISLKNDADEIVTFSNDNKIFSAINEVRDSIPEIDETISSSSTNPVQNQAIFSVIKDNEEVVANAIKSIQDSCGLTDTLKYSGPEDTTAIADAIELIYNKIEDISDDEYVKVIDITSIVEIVNTLASEAPVPFDPHYTESDDFGQAFVLRYIGMSTSHHINIASELSIPATLLIDGNACDVDYGVDTGDTNMLLRVDCLYHIDTDIESKTNQPIYLISYLNNDEEWVLCGKLDVNEQQLTNTGVDRKYKGYSHLVFNKNYDFWYALIQKHLSCVNGGDGTVVYDVTELLDEIGGGQKFDTMADTVYATVPQSTQFKLLADGAPSIHYAMWDNTVRIDCIFHSSTDNYNFNRLFGTYVVSQGNWVSENEMSWSIIGLIWFDETGGIISPITEIGDDEGYLYGYDITWWEQTIEKIFNENKVYVQVATIDPILKKSSLPSTDFEERKYITTLSPFILQFTFDDTLVSTNHYRIVYGTTIGESQYNIRIDCFMHYSGIGDGYVLSEVGSDDINSYAVLGIVVHTQGGEYKFMPNVVDGSETSLLGQAAEWWYHFAQDATGDNIAEIYTTLSGAIDDIQTTIVDNEKVTANSLNTLRTSCGFDENGLYAGPSGTTSVDEAITFLYNKLVAQLELNQSLQERITALENKTVSLHLDENGVLSINNE